MTISLIKSSNFWPGGARPKKPRTQPRDTRSAGAYRAEVALLFLVQEARGPNLGTGCRPAPRAEGGRRGGGGGRQEAGLD